jgi:hypothetical protein
MCQQVNICNFLWNKKSSLPHLCKYLYLLYFEVGTCSFQQNPQVQYAVPAIEFCKKIIQHLVTQWGFMESLCDWNIYAPSNCPTAIIC